MKAWAWPFLLLALVVGIGVGVITVKADAQTGPSLSERQVRALETIAREMSHMRREKCR